VTVDVKIKFLDTNTEKTVPFYATSGSAGMDLTACLKEDVTLEPLERKIIPTGISIGLPSPDYAAFVFARSGLASFRQRYPNQQAGHRRGQLVIQAYERAVFVHKSA